jgi:hypothetical protein
VRNAGLGGGRRFVFPIRISTAQRKRGIELSDSKPLPIEQDGNDLGSAPTLASLVERVRAAHAAYQAAQSNALGHAFAAGEILIEIERRGVQTAWKHWLRENCHFGVSTAQLYMQLARHRAKIEAKLRDDPDFSLRAARRLIAKPPGAAGAPKPKLDLLTAWKTATLQERTAALARIPITDFLQALPSAWRSELERRAGKGASIKDEVFQRESEILRNAVSLLKTAAAGSPDETQALTALRKLAAVLANIDIDEITIVKRYAKERRRAA